MKEKNKKREKIYISPWKQGGRSVTAPLHTLTLLLFLGADLTMRWSMLQLPGDEIQALSISSLHQLNSI